MDRRSWLSPALICCLGLLMVSCSSLTGPGKANKETGSAAGQSKSAKHVEATNSGTAEAAAREVTERKWETYASDKQGIDYYLDRETIAFPSRTLVRVWRRRVFPLTSPQREIISLDEIDCGSREARYRSLEVTAVYQDGKTRTFKVTSPWNRIWSDSPDEVLFLDVCKAAANSK